MEEYFDFTILPQSGKGFELKKGDYLQVIDVEGSQVADMWAIVINKEKVDWLSASQTRDINERLFPMPGEHFYSDKGYSLLTLIEDNSPCTHDMLFPACNQMLYEKVGLPNHPNCRDNFLGAQKNLGVELPFVPDPVNLFQCSEPQIDGKLEVSASINPPGGNVLLCANENLYVIITACSVDYHPTNGDKCTSIKIKLYSPNVQ